MESHSAISFSWIKVSFTLLAANTQGTTFLVLLLLGLLLLTSIISGAEVALFSLGTKEIDVLKTKQHPAAKRIIKFLEEPKEVYASLLIASIFLNISIIILFNFLVSQFVNFGTLYFAIELLSKVLVIAFVLVFFGEIFPKYWATPE